MKSDFVLNHFQLNTTTIEVDALENSNKVSTYIWEHRQKLHSQKTNTQKMCCKVCGKLDGTSIFKRKITIIKMIPCDFLSDRNNFGRLHRCVIKNQCFNLRFLFYSLFFSSLDLHFVQHFVCTIREINCYFQLANKIPIYYSNYHYFHSFSASFVPLPTAIAKKTSHFKTSNDLFLFVNCVGIECIMEKSRHLRSVNHIIDSWFERIAHFEIHFFLSHTDKSNTKCIRLNYLTTMSLFACNNIIICSVYNQFNLELK